MTKPKMETEFVDCKSKNKKKRWSWSGIGLIQTKQCLSNKITQIFVSITVVFHIIKNGRSCLKQEFRTELSILFTSPQWDTMMRTEYPKFILLARAKSPVVEEWIQSDFLALWTDWNWRFGTRLRPLASVPVRDWLLTKMNVIGAVRPVRVIRHLLLLHPQNVRR